MFTVKVTYCILKAEQHRLQAVQRQCGSNEHCTKAQQATGQLFPVRGPDVVSQADNELLDVICSERWSLIVLLTGKKTLKNEDTVLPVFLLWQHSKTSAIYKSALHLDSLLYQRYFKPVGWQLWHYNEKHCVLLFINNSLRQKWKYIKNIKKTKFQDIQTFIIK